MRLGNKKCGQNQLRLCGQESFTFKSTMIITPGWIPNILAGHWFSKRGDSTLTLILLVASLATEELALSHGCTTRIPIYLVTCGVCSDVVCTVDWRKRLVLSPECIKEAPSI